MQDVENQIYIQEDICKSVIANGDTDENGNYIFEVEASNESLDLQNQVTLQSALLDSKEYFLTNGVISDDHLHKTRNANGDIETHKEKIIGEPISIRTEGKSTFVKGILYKGVAAAKDYINLLKNKSTRVKASIGGIKPLIKKNSDGTETVTSFMWNDLALTCSPVNWTVGSAKFAKSIHVLEFCKSLNAGTGTDSSNYINGRALQNEDLEKETVKLNEITDGDLIGESKKDDLEKSKENYEDIISECKLRVEKGYIETPFEAELFLRSNGVDIKKARELSLEIIEEGGMKMKKSNFSSMINEILKSSMADEDEEKKKDSEDEESDETPSLFDDETDEENTEEESDKDEESDEEVEKGCNVKKSFNENVSWLDATEVVSTLGKSIDGLKEENEQLRRELNDMQEAVVNVTKSLKEFLSVPEKRNTVISKSMKKDDEEILKGPSKRPTNADFDILKSALVEASKQGKVSLNEVQYLNTEFQKSMKGISISSQTWNKICNIVKQYR